MSMKFTDPAALDKDSLETGTAFAPRFDDKGLIPAITQDADSGDVLMFAFMNTEALAKTISSGEAHYWSRSRNALWHKGATSGHVQKVVEMRTDCDQDVIVLRVSQKDAACHRGYRSCFYRVVDGERLDTTETPLKSPEEIYGGRGS